MYIGFSMSTPNSWSYATFSYDTHLSTTDGVLPLMESMIHVFVSLYHILSPNTPMSKDWKSEFHYRNTMVSDTCSELRCNCITAMNSFPKMTYKTSQMSVRPSMWCQHFQNPKAPRPLGWHWWNLASIFYGSGEQTTRKQNFELQPQCHTGAPDLAQSFNKYCIL